MKNNLSLQSLPPRQAKFCLKIEKICRSVADIRAGQKLLLAVSGGADSVALAAIFHILVPRLGVELAAMHVDHGLRASAAADAAFSMRLCQSLNIDFHVEKANVRQIAHAEASGIEEAGRKARYQLLESHAGDIGASHILMAHHAGDLSEDILMRLLRGAGWPALGGMGWRNGLITRPLLHESPDSLREFARSCGLGWREDESNSSLAFRRNRVRHLLMPMLRCENPSICQTLPRLHIQAAVDADYWQRELDKALAGHPWQERAEGGIYLARELLSPMHPALRIRLYNRVLNHLREQSGCVGQNSHDALTGIEDMFQAKVGKKRIQCAGGIDAIYENGGILLRHASTIED